MAPVEDLVLLDLDRSNKGASKQRRDQINAEINILRDLLPLPESSRQRLSQLQVMSLSCVYIRKCNILQKIFRQRSQETHLPDCLDFFQAMTGFLLVATRAGKLVYISENVTDYLGHSMVDMKTQGDSLYDIIDKRDHGTVQAKLAQGGARDGDGASDISFFCRMNMSRTLKRQSGFGDVKVMHIQGHFVPVNGWEADHLGDQQQVFMASCSPLMTPDLKENLVLHNTMVFKTVHQLDMVFMEATKMAEHHLGYTSEELCKTSWYNLIHPEDIHEAKEKHMQLVRSNHHEIGCMMTIRMMKADSSIFWVNVVMHVKQTLLSQNEEPYIVCINQIISAKEAYQIKGQGQLFSMYPGRVQELWGSHVSGMSPTQSFNGGQWIQQEGSGPVPVPSYQCTVPNYPNQSGYTMMYPSACNSMTDLDRSRKTTKNGIPNLVQTDKLKAMLKRKIQGPTTQTHSRQAKAPKMAWDVDGQNEIRSYSEMGAPSLTVTDQFVSGETRQAINQQGQVVQVMVATAAHPTGVYMTKSTPETSADFKAVQRRVKVEQVVPDINVPDSYLTPDPSPISSPEPSSTVKTEVMDPDDPQASCSSSVSILQALEKLACQPQEGLMAKSHPVNITRTDQLHSRGSGKMRNRELPIFDAFEIDNFFEMLGLPDDFSKAPFKMEDIKTEDLETNAMQPHIMAKDDLQSPPLKKEDTSGFVSKQLVEGSKQIPLLAPVLEVPTFSIKTEKIDTEVLSCQTCPRKDLVVSSTMIQSPGSVGSHNTLTRGESLDDLLSCFSDEGVVPSPLETDCSSSIGKTGDKDGLEMAAMSPFNSLYQMSAYRGCAHAVGELSPQSTTSCLSRDDDLLDKSWRFAIDLDLEGKEDVQSPLNASTRPQDHLPMESVFDQVELLLNSLVPSQGCLDL